jgi:hypothetical protein
MKKRKSIPIEESFVEWRRDPAFAKAYEALDEEFALAEALIDGRSRAGQSQKAVARRKKTSQPSKRARAR